MRKAIIILTIFVLIGAASAALIFFNSNKSKNEFLPVLYYHAVNNSITGIEDLFVAPSEFERQMKYLKNNNYTIITFDNIHKYKKIHKPVIITFDDGYEDNYTYAYPVLKRYGFRASVFLCTDFIDKPLYLKSSQIQEMKSLISFQSHTKTHANLTDLEDDMLEQELLDSKNILEDILGQKVQVLSYPLGDYDERVLKTARKYYKYGVLNGEGLYSNADNDMEIRRLYIPRSMNMEEFKAAIKGEKSNVEEN